MIFLVDLPLPVHGMSTVNKFVLKKVKEAGLKVDVINSVPSYAANYFETLLWPFIKVIHTIYCISKLAFLLGTNRKQLVYWSVNSALINQYCGNTFHQFRIWVVSGCRLHFELPRWSNFSNIELSAFICSILRTFILGI